MGPRKWYRAKRLTDQVVSFSGTLGTRVKQAPPRDPETKGIVERHNRYLETSFFPGRHFDDPHDAQSQLDEWIEQVANRRKHATLKERPVDRWVIEHEAMRGLPPCAPTVGLHTQLRLPRNYYVTVDTNRYSVNPKAIGRLVTVKADLETVRVVDNTSFVLATHARNWGRNQVITDAKHLEMAKCMRQELARPVQLSQGVEQADLSVYDGLTR